MEYTRQNDLYCCYKLQLEKRQARGELCDKLDNCVKCNGYDKRCEHYTPLELQKPRSS